MNSKHTRLEAHTGIDYTVVMFPEQGTDDAAIRVYGENAEAVGARLAACWNACEGIDDPAAALAEVRKAFRLAEEALRFQAMQTWSDGGMRRAKALDALGAALGLLGGA